MRLASLWSHYDSELEEIHISREAFVLLAELFFCLINQQFIHSSPQSGILHVCEKATGSNDLVHWMHRPVFCARWGWSCWAAAECRVNHGRTTCHCYNAMAHFNISTLIKWQCVILWHLSTRDFPRTSAASLRSTCWCPSAHCWYHVIFVISC